MNFIIDNIIHGYDIWYDIYDNIIYDMKYTIYEFFRYK